MKPTKKLINKSLRPGLFGPGVGPELPMTPGAIMDQRKEAKSAAQAAADAEQRARDLVMPSPDDAAALLAKRRQAARMRRGSGRMSTILADTGSLG